MSTFMLLLGVFVGGAAPWLEAIIVIPAGIVGGLHPVAAVAAGASGNVLTVWVAAYAGDRIRKWWKSRRDNKRSKRSAATSSTSVTSVSSAPDSDLEVVPATADDTETPTDSDEPAKNTRARRVLERWGLPMLAVVGPIGLGTQLSAVVAVGFGISAARTFRWIAAATVLWSIVAAALTVTGLEFTGLTSG